MYNANLQHVNSGEASLTILECHAKISVFIDHENNQFLKKINDLKFANHDQIVRLALPLAVN